MPPHPDVLHSFIPTDGERLLLVAALAACILVIYVTLVFLIAQLKKDNSVMDIFYGPAFAVTAWGTLHLLGTTVSSPLALTIIIFITLWATRLAIRIARKNWGRPEDARYAAWREVWTKRGTLYFLIRSYLQINLLQGVIILIVLSPALIALATVAMGGTIDTLSPYWFFAGTAIWLTGFLIEIIADWQLDQFIARKKAGTEPATLMTRGLFHYSRRPNYFGESLIWWGLAIMVAPLPYGWIAFISPLLITFILTRVTGPMLEDIFLEKYPAEYRQYMATTSYFIPWRKKQ